MSEVHQADEGRENSGNRHEPGLYEIRIKGHLDDRWAASFEDLTLSRDGNGETLLTGHVVDQAALYGLLRKVRDLGAPLISVTLIETDRTGADRPERRVPLTDA